MIGVFFFLFSFFLVNHLSKIISLGQIEDVTNSSPSGIPDTLPGISGLPKVFKVPGK